MDLKHTPRTSGGLIKGVGRIGGVVGTYGFLLAITVIALLPMVWVILSSFKTNAEILSSGLSLPTHLSFSGFVTAFKMAPLALFFFNSFVIAVISTVFNVLVVSMAAYVIARFEFRFKNLVIILLTSSMMIPMVALMHPIFMVIKALGLYDTKLALILVYSGLGLPMSLLILRSYFLSIPAGLEEAAAIDGAGFLRTFFQIILPIAKPGLASAAVLQFLLCWNEFLFALMLTSSKEVRTLPLSLSYFTSQFSFNYTAMFSAITVAIIPSILIYAVFQEQIVRSITAGSMKE